MGAFDFAVTGSGSGLDVASVAADREEPVPVVGNGPLGGTHPNRGSIPAKQSRYRADVRETIARADEFHLDPEVTEVDFAAMVRAASGDVADSGLVGLDDHDCHPGIRSLVADDYGIITL